MRSEAIKDNMSLYYLKVATSKMISVASSAQTPCLARGGRWRHPSGTDSTGDGIFVAKIFRFSMGKDLEARSKSRGHFVFDLQCYRFP